MNYNYFKNYIIDKAQMIGEDISYYETAETEPEVVTETASDMLSHILEFTIHSSDVYSPAISTTVRIDLVELFQDLQYEKNDQIVRKIDALFNSMETTGCKLGTEAYIKRLSGVELKRYNALKELRAEIAEKEGVRLYMIFDNRTLAEMSRLKPESKAAMQTIHGVGAVKMAKYGEQFFDLLRELA